MRIALYLLGSTIGGAVGLSQLAETLQMAETGNLLAASSPTALRFPFLDPVSLLARFITTQRFSVLLLLNFFQCSLFLLGRFLVFLCLGNLRDIEFQTAQQRIVDSVLLKATFLVAVVLPKMEELVIWTIWFGIFIFLRVLGLTCRDRFDYLSSFLGIPMKTHLRIIFLLTLILVTNLVLTAFCYSAFKGHWVLFFLFSYECATLFLETVFTLVKYLCHLGDLSNDNFWDFRSSTVYYTELITEVLKKCLVMAYNLIVMFFHGFTFSLAFMLLLWHVVLEFHSLRNQIFRFIEYKSIVGATRSVFVDATPEDLHQFGDICAICRDEMDSAKKLPCGHMFHLFCLRAWITQHNSCPTCRMALSDNRISFFPFGTPHAPEGNHPQVPPPPPPQAVAPLNVNVVNLPIIHPSQIQREFFPQEHHQNPPRQVAFIVTAYSHPSIGSARTNPPGRNPPEYVEVRFQQTLPIMPHQPHHFALRSEDQEEIDIGEDSGFSGILSSSSSSNDFQEFHSSSTFEPPFNLPSQEEEGEEEEPTAARTMPLSSFRRRFQTEEQGEGERYRFGSSSYSSSPSSSASRAGGYWAGPSGSGK